MRAVLVVDPEVVADAEDPFPYEISHADPAFPRASGGMRTRPAAVGLDMASHARVRAPELTGEGGWLNTGGTDLTLAGLRGRIVLLDFWTFCCVNCLHVLDELRELEEQHRDTLVVVGVHSPKFAHEADHRAVVDAVERYQVEHPVLDDPELATWKQYAVRAWPTLVVDRPRGLRRRAARGRGARARHRDAGGGAGAGARGEGHAAAGRRPRTCRRSRSRPPCASPGRRCGCRAAATSSSRTRTRHQLVELAPDGETVRAPRGHRRARVRGRRPGQARFSEPQGLALLPGTGTVVVADTVNHALRGVRPGERRGQSRWRGPASSGGRAPASERARARGRALLALGRGVVRRPAVDRDGRGAPAVDVRRRPRTATRTARCGSRRGRRTRAWSTGPRAQAWFAQPSGLAASDDGERLWIADSETSAVRWIERDGAAGAEARGPGERRANARRAYGRGHGPLRLRAPRRDRPAQALLQHPLGVTALPGGGSPSATRTTTRCAATTRSAAK